MLLLAASSNLHGASGRAVRRQQGESGSRSLRPADAGRPEASLSALEEKTEVMHKSLALEEPLVQDASSAFRCKVCLAALVANVILSPLLTSVAGQYSVAAGWIVPFVVGIYLFYTRTLQMFLSGAAMSRWCQGLCVWFSVSLFLLAMWTLIYVVHIMPTLMISAKALHEFKNESVKGIREKFDELEAELSDRRKAYYKSKKFKAKCDRLFDDADKDGNGILDMKELREAVLHTTEDPDSMKEDEQFVKAFDEDGNSLVEKDEFYEMMKYFDIVNPGGFLQDTDSSSDESSSSSDYGKSGTAGPGKCVSNYYDDEDSEESSAVTDSRDPSKSDGPSRGASKAERHESRTKSRTKSKLEKALSTKSRKASNRSGSNRSGSNKVPQDMDIP